MSVVAILMLTVSGCAPVVSAEAFTDELDPLVTAHAAALADGTEAEKLQTGRDLISTYDCVTAKESCPQ